ncbi:hypothetical protein [Bradyrhizobium sp. AUGA SZCCT0431]|uniref:hypothetical protein n=1 Tax=Bradyrhizobium sp. AUGA SZCCT0431 TaxID=2807674 RepID=UPI00390886A8
MHRQGRPHRAIQLRHLQFDADRGDAEGGVGHRAERRLLGRRWRTDDLRRGARRAQCVFRGNGKAHPLGAVEGSRHQLRLTTRAAAFTGRRPPNFGI